MPNLIANPGEYARAQRIDQLAAQVRSINNWPAHPRRMAERMLRIRRELEKKTPKRSLDKFESVKENLVFMDRYVARRIIGISTHMITYLAEDDSNGNRVAVKQARDPAKNNLIRNEMQILSRLCHPNIIQLSGMGNDYFVMELLNGAPFDRFSLHLEDFALAVMYEAAEGMRCVHQQGCVHRDIKTDHIYISRRGGVKIIDFGLARDLNNEKDIGKADTFWGTPEFAAPEVIAHGAGFAEKEVDFFSLGVSMYHQMLRKLPAARKIKIRDEWRNVSFPKTGPALKSRLLKFLSPQTRLILSGLLERDPAKRLADPDELQRMILKALFL